MYIKSTGFVSRDRPANHSHSKNKDIGLSASIRTGVVTLSRLNPGEFFIQEARPSPKGTPPLILSESAAKPELRLNNARYRKYPASDISARVAAAKWYFEWVRAYCTNNPDRLKPTIPTRLRAITPKPSR